VAGFVDRARREGATPEIGGQRVAHLNGCYYEPTLFVEPPAESEILREEVFGPVLTLQAFEDEDDAVRMANDTEYGLAATIFTGSQARADRVSARVVAGTVWVNCFYVRDLRVPFGGARKSGIGREGGRHSFDFYCDLKTVVERHGTLG
jgi:acyl-CoA reductase-like NAD-dependent aldehyde dehydrogenase